MNTIIDDWELAIAYRLWFQRASLQPEPRHIIDEFDRNAKPLGCLSIRVLLPDNNNLK